MKTDGKEDGLMLTKMSISKQSRIRWFRVSSIVMAALALAIPGWAQDAGGKVELHGFGGWAYAQTDGNGYLIGSEQGNYDNLALALNVNAMVSEKLTIVGQFELEQRAGYSKEEQSLEFAFAEWKFTDALRLRMGRVKHPFGLYGEIFNVGTLRPFYMLPQSIYGPERYTGNSVDGLSFTGGHTLKNNWGLSYDVYGGRISGKLRIIGAGSEPADLQMGMSESSFVFEEVVGGRVIIQPPIDGLSFGASAYRGVGQSAVGTGSTEKALLGHAEYLSGPALLRAEWGTIYGNPINRIEGFYVEGAYMVWKGLQFALRFDGWDGHVKDKELWATIAPWILKIQDSNDLGVGVNYWFNPGFVVKLNFHSVRGNRFAMPTNTDVLDAVPVTGEIERDTKMIVFGAQFSF